MKSVLRYPGGKTRAVKILEKYIPEGIEKVVSPFLGGGSFELRLCELGIKVDAYDYFEDLVIFWNQLFKNKHNLYEVVLKFYPMEKELFYELQKKDKSSLSDVERASIFYALNRSSFSGSTLSGGMSPNTPRFNESSLKRILSFNEDNITVKHSHFEKVLKENKNEFLFLDPPYYIENYLYGKKGDKHKNFEHELLHELLKDCDKFMLCYNDCEYIRGLYSDCEVVKLNWKYGMNKTKESSEILILKGIKNDQTS